MLSDVALRWMIDKARSIPHPLIVDDARLSIWPDALGQQHSELESVWVPNPPELPAFDPVGLRRIAEAAMARVWPSTNA